jgi:transposase
MKRFVEGADRDQRTLFPECLEDWVGEDNAVRVIDVFVDSLDLVGLGFSGVAPQSTGRPSYHPSVLLKLYVYGYLNAVQSSRRLEREAGRNVEVMWLTRRLVPDHKTIADFRKDNGPSIRKVCARFVELCRRIGLLAHAGVAIDGSKFKAVNNRDRNFTEAKMKRRMAQIEESVARYLHQLDSADRQEPSKARAMKSTRLKEKIAKLQAEMARLEALDRQRQAQPDKQISLTDPDARSMATSGRGSGVVGYNVQAAVDTEHHLIVAHDVVQTGNDRDQLARMSKLTKRVLGVEKLDVVADRGYFASEQILECVEANVTVTLPKPQTSGSKAQGRFVKADFRYVPDRDVYICPAGEALRYRMQTIENGLTLRRYWSDACLRCAIKQKCTTGRERRITRWEHEHVLEDVQRRLDENPQAMRTRRETVEHPFGTIKARMGATHFLTKRLKNVKTEMALAVLAYNLTRVMNIVGIGPLIEAIRARFDSFAGALAAAFAIRPLLGLRGPYRPQISQVSFSFSHCSASKPLNSRFYTAKTPSRPEQLQHPSHTVERPAEEAVIDGPRSISISRLEASVTLPL